MKRFFTTFSVAMLVLACIIVMTSCSVIDLGNEDPTNTSGNPSTGGPGTSQGGDETTAGDEKYIPVETVAPPPLQLTIDPTTLSGQQKTTYEWCDKAYAASKEAKSLGKNSETADIESRWSTVYKIVCDQMTRYYDYYVQGGMAYKNFESLMLSFAEIPSASGIAKGYIEVAKTKRTDVDLLSNAISYANSGKFMQASKAISKIANASSLSSIKKIISSNTEAFKKGVTDAVTEYMVRYDLEEGKRYIEALRGLGIDDHVNSEANRLEEYRKFQDVDLVNCNVTNSLENIYTHCLIAYPEINFASEKTYRWCGDDCFTVSEFVTVLNELYNKGYIIVDANLFYNAETDSPNNTIKLPRGKKPLLFTFDDVTYDSRKDNRGMVDKLILDEDGYICTYTKHEDGTEVISYENEIFPIINAFVREHPDFTFHGARGTLFFTGFDGICGYRTQSEPVDAAEAALNLDRQSEIVLAKQVIEALRDEGWTFGSHSYNHSRMPRLSPESFRKDTDMWLEEVGAIVGDTILFCWPYGGHTENGVNLRKNAEHKYLFDSGFKFFFGCGAARYFANEPDGNGIFSDRKAITGEALYYYLMEYKTYIREYSYLFDPNAIWDPLRIPYKYMPPYSPD